MSNFGEAITVKGIKWHRCIACYQGIPAGHLHIHFKGKWGGEWQDWRMHPECHAAMSDDDLNDGFDPGGMERPKPEAGEQPEGKGGL